MTRTILRQRLLRGANLFSAAAGSELLYRAQDPKSKKGGGVPYLGGSRLRAIGASYTIRREKPMACQTRPSPLSSSIFEGGGGGRSTTLDRCVHLGGFLKWSQRSKHAGKGAYIRLKKTFQRKKPEVRHRHADFETVTKLVDGHMRSTSNLARISVSESLSYRGEI